MDDNESHTYSVFDDELDALRSMVADMGQQTITAIHDCAEALVGGNAALADQVERQDRVIDDYHTRVGGMVMRCLTRQQPFARDLREILACEHMANELERCGDHARNIARRSHHIAHPMDALPASQVRWLVARVTGMLGDVLDAFAHKDADKAQRVREADDDLDVLYQHLFDHLQQCLADGSATAQHSGQMVLIAKSLERVGDHAASMAADVLFVVTGDPHRHQN